MGHGKLQENLKIQTCIYPQDIDTADVTSTYYDMALFGRIAFRAFVKSLPTTKILTLTLKEATNSAGAGAQTLGTAVTGTATGSPTEDLEALIEARAEDLSDGYTHIGVVIGTNNGSSLTGGAVALLGDARQKPVSNA